MTEPPDATNEPGDRRDAQDPNDGMPRWVKASLLVVVVVIVVFVILQVTGLAPGEHGPGLHGSGRHGGG